MKIITGTLILAFTVCSFTLIKKEPTNLATQDLESDFGICINSIDFNKYQNCLNSDSLVIIINRFIVEGDLSRINCQSLYQFLILNGSDESKCHFPRNNHEIDLLNSFIIELIDFSENNDTATLLLIYIFDTSRRNIELTEYLQDILANLFVNNSRSYINALANIDGDMRKRAIGIVEFIHDKDDLNSLQKTINSYKIDSQYEFLTDIEIVINKELLR